MITSRTRTATEACGAGIENDLLVNTDTALYDYSLADQKTTEILSWLDSDINGSYVTHAAATVDVRSWQ